MNDRLFDGSAEDKARIMADQAIVDTLAYQRLQRLPNDEEYSSSRILKQLEYMDERVSILTRAVSELEAKLDPILLPGPPEQGDIVKAPEFPSSEVSRSMDNLNGRVNRIFDQINDIATRVQL